MSNKREILEKLADSVKSGDKDAARKGAEEALKARLDPLEIVEGLSKGITELGEALKRGEVMMAQLGIGEEVMKAGMEVLKPALMESKKEVPILGKVVIGVAKGDIHAIGKTLVACMLTAVGFDVVDLGVDVPEEVFVEKVRELKPDILAVGAPMTTTTEGQRRVIEALNKAGLREKVTVIVGGKATTLNWAEEIGADTYGEDAVDALRIAKKVMGID